MLARYAAKEKHTSNGNCKQLGQSLPSDGYLYVISASGDNLLLSSCLAYTDRTRPCNSRVHGSVHSRIHGSVHDRPCTGRVDLYASIEMLCRPINLTRVLMSNT